MSPQHVPYQRVMRNATSADSPLALTTCPTHDRPASPRGPASPRHEMMNVYVKPWEAHRPWPRPQPVGPHGLQRSHSVDGYYTEQDMLTSPRGNPSPRPDPTPLSEYRTSYRHEQPAPSSLGKLRDRAAGAAEGLLGKGSVYQHHMPHVAGRIFRAKLGGSAEAVHV